jgi:DNA primase
MPKYIDFAELKERVSIEDVFPMLDLEMQQKGDQWRGPCPACDSRDRTLVVTSSKQSFYCFAARKGGDLIALVAHVRDLGMRDAALAIADFCGTVTVTDERNSNRSDGTVPNSARGKDDGKRTLQPLAYLQSDHEVVEALGLSSETCEHFGAGYAPKGIMRGRLAIPIHDLNGELVAYCGRAVRDGQRPVLAFPKGFDSSRHVFNLHRMEEGELYCSSDPLDVLLAFENGVENAIAFLHRAEETNVVPMRQRA